MRMILRLWLARLLVVATIVGGALNSVHAASHTHRAPVAAAPGHVHAPHAHSHAARHEHGNALGGTVLAATPHHHDADDRADGPAGHQPDDSAPCCPHSFGHCCVSPAIATNVAASPAALPPPATLAAAAAAIPPGQLPHPLLRPPKAG